LLALAGSGLGAFGIAALTAGRAESAETSALSDTERTNERTVRDFCAAWSTLDANRVGAFFADDAVYRVLETAKPLIGRDAILKFVGTSLMRSQKVHFDIHRQYAAGPIVLNERHDHFVSARGERVFHVAGMFFLKNGKIAEWTDYVIAT